MEKFKTFFYFAIIVLLAMIIFIAGAVSASTGVAFNIVVGILAMLEALAGLFISFKKLREKSQS